MENQDLPWLRYRRKATWPKSTSVMNASKSIISPAVHALIVDWDLEINTKFLSKQRNRDRRREFSVHRAPGENSIDFGGKDGRERERERAFLSIRLCRTKGVKGTGRIRRLWRCLRRWKFPFFCERHLLVLT